jgi:hypothetical protein
VLLGLVNRSCTYSRPVLVAWAKVGLSASWAMGAQTGLVATVPSVDWPATVVSLLTCPGATRDRGQLAHDQRRAAVAALGEERISGELVVTQNAGLVAEPPGGIASEEASVLPFT